MKRSCLLLTALVFALSARAEPPSAASLADALHQLTIDPAEIYHVRDLRLSRGDAKFYLTDGYLAFAKPVAGKHTAAVFTVAGLELGDAELVVSPPSRGERASLAYFAKTPNIDEHFKDAVFLFTDATRADAMRQVDQSESRAAPEQATTLAQTWNPVLRNVATDVDMPLMASLLNEDPPEEGVFYAVVGGRTLGAFDVSYNPRQVENTLVGKVTELGKRPRFELWTSFAARKAPVKEPVEPVRIDSYRIRATVQPDLKVSGVTQFLATPRVRQLRAIDLQISELMKVTGASINGEPAEVFQHESIRGVNEDQATHFLLIARTALRSAEPVKIQVHHQGAVIEDAGDGIYFVQARNIWFPHLPFGSTTFDLTFESPPALRVVSSGKLVDESVIDGRRVVHRILESPARFVGFNVGDFASVQQDDAFFHVECFGNRPRSSDSQPALQEFLNALASRSARILEAYSSQWGPPPTNNIAVTPIPGTFGQGFPGLIYLSTNSYRFENRPPPPALHPMLDMFYSDILLPHEIAHQWWGNLVVPSDYRSGWLVEALANHAALELLGKERGSRVVEQVLGFYSKELARPGPDGAPLESVGPLDLGMRLKALDDPNVWRVITYDKGTWVIRMLRERLGEAPFAQFLRTLAAEYRNKPLSNEEFRAAAAKYLPKTDPDPTLETFFESWVYRTGIPRLSLRREAGTANQYDLQVSQVDKSFAIDVPVSIQTPGAGTSIQWVRAGFGDTVFQVAGPSSSRAVLPSSSEFLYAPS